jgi:hypothetical protein
MRRREPTPKATIVVEVDEDFLGQSYTYNTGGHVHPKVTLINKFAEVSCDTNGKPEFFGNDILSKFSENEEIEDEYELLENVYLHIIAEGNCKIVGDPLYDSWKKDNWDVCKPIFYGSIPEMKEDYQYLFQNREWYVRSRVDDSILDFTKLSEVIPRDNSK